MQLSQWPTLVVGLLIYGLFFGLTLYWVHIPWPILLILGGIVTAWYASLEHEVIHGHPTRWHWLNRVSVLFPLLLWLPFGSYAQTHRAHHRDAVLTDPFDDPETYYMAQGRWDGLRPWQQRYLRACNTLAGRMTLGLFVTVYVFLCAEAKLAWQGQADRRRIWALHLGLVGLVVAYLHLICAMPIWVYGLCFVLPGTSLILLRAFLEHQYAENPKHRTAIVEAGWFWRLLFLNNSYHLVHHEHPDMPWYDLPGEYARNQGRYHELSGGYILPGYGFIARRFAMRAKEPVRHPQR